jgi:hypothetical protein
MKVLVRLFLLVGVTVWLALPGIGSDGGESAGGTGVWILPRPTFLASGSPSVTTGCEPRGTMAITSPDAPLVLKTGDELGAFSATLIDPWSGVPVSLPTNGREVVVPTNLLRALREAAASADIVVNDSQQLGYVMRVVFDPATGSGLIKVY